MVGNVGLTKYSNYFKKTPLKGTLDSMCTRGRCKLSEKELVAKIRDLARRDAAAGKNSLLDDCHIGSEWNNLQMDFISFVSPDRAGIIQKKLAQLTGTGTTSRVKGFDVFNILNRKGRRHDPDVSGNRISFKDERGREVACYATTVGWYFTDTDAERTRSYAFLDLWNQALADAQKELEAEVEDGIIFEARA